MTQWRRRNVAISMGLLAILAGSMILHIFGGSPGRAAGQAADGVCRRGIA